MAGLQGKSGSNAMERSGINRACRADHFNHNRARGRGWGWLSRERNVGVNALQYFAFILNQEKYCKSSFFSKTDQSFCPLL